MTTAHSSHRSHLVRIILVLCTLAASIGIAMALPGSTASAEGSYAAGLPQPTPAPGGGWNGGYNMPFGLGFCITPGGASPTEAPDGEYGPIGFPGGNTYSSGQMGALMYLATWYANSGWDGYDANTTSAVIASISKDYGGGDNLPAVVNQTEKTAMINWISTYPGPWSPNVTMPATDGAGGTYTTFTNHSGNLQILAANGNPVPGIPGTIALGSLTNFVWNNGTGVSDNIGNIGFTFNVSTAGAFSGTIGLGGGAPLATPNAYGPPGGTGYQNIIMAGVGSPTSPVSGTASTSNAPASLSIQKSSTDPAYLGNNLGGAVFQVIDNSASAGAGPRLATVVATLTTDSSGAAGPVQVPSGVTYTIHESVAPPGMTPAPDQTWSPASGAVATYHFVDGVSPVHLVVNKVDSDTHLGLAGAQFTVAYDAANNGNYNQNVVGPNPDGSFTTDSSGVLIDPNATLANLVPGNYLVTETVAPPNHSLPIPASQVVAITVGSNATVTFSDITLPTVVTSPAAYSAVGGSLKDSATISNASPTAGGSVSFTAYGPFATANSVTCVTGTKAFTSVPVPVSGSGTYTMSDSFTPTTVGLYQWVASYTGDANNTPVAGACSDTTEQSTVVDLSTAATPAAGVGADLRDVATVNAPVLAGGGTVTFSAYGPYASQNSATCTGTAAFTSAGVAVSANATAKAYAMTDSYQAPTAGVYDWVAKVVDSHGATVAIGACKAASEVSDVVGLSTQATATASTDTSSPSGNVIADTAILTGAVPAGSVLTFRAYGPYPTGTGNTCADGALVFTSAPQTVNGAGSVTSNQFTVTQAGTYEWVATLADSTGAVIVAGTCGAGGESSAVSPPSPPTPVTPPVPPVPVTG